MGTLTELCEQGWLPDAVTRFGMRNLNRRRLLDEGLLNAKVARLRRQRFLADLARGDIAPHGQAAREQHYEVPAAFYQRVLGPRLKYSSGWFDTGREDLAEGEAHMLRLACERAGVEDGMRVLDLGCGWGSLSLWLAEHYPSAQITGVSNSASQKAFIDARAAEHGFDNIQVITADVNDFQAPGRYERVMSVEMFEHMRNYALLLERVRGWLADDGRAFIHIFCHRRFGYPFEEEVGEDGNWMGRYFFSGGVMPSFDVFEQFTDHLRPEQQWWVNGRHYERTCNLWLANLDRQRVLVGDIFRDTYGGNHATVWVQRWRMFFMACAELFGMRAGRSWGVGHYLLAPA